MHCSDGQAYVRRSVRKSVGRYWYLKTRRKLSDARYYGYDVLKTLVRIYLSIFFFIFIRDDHIEDLSIDKDNLDVMIPGIDIRRRHFDSGMNLLRYVL